MPAVNDGQPSAPKRNAIQMAFRWRAGDDPLIVLFGSTHPSTSKYIYKKKIKIKKNVVKESWTPSDKIFWIRACSSTTSHAVHVTREIVSSIARMGSDHTFKYTIYIHL